MVDNVKDLAYIKKQAKAKKTSARPNQQIELYTRKREHSADGRLPCRETIPIRRYDRVSIIKARNLSNSKTFDSVDLDSAYSCYIPFYSHFCARVFLGKVVRKPYNVFLKTSRKYTSTIRSVN